MDQQSMPQPNEPNSDHKHWITIISVIVTAIVVGAGVYIWQNSNLKSTKQSLQEQITVLQNQIQLLQQDTKVSDSQIQEPAKSSTDSQGATQTDNKYVEIVDKASLYSVNIPADWEITSNEGAMGVQLSRILAQSADWSSYSDETYEGPFSPQYYQSGGALQLHVTQGESEPAHYGEGGGPETGVIAKKAVTIDGVEGVYHVFKEPSTFEGQLIDVHINYKGNNYLLRLAYNPANFNGEEFFDNLLNSVRFLK